MAIKGGRGWKWLLGWLYSIFQPHVASFGFEICHSFYPSAMILWFCNCEFCNHTLFFYRKDAASWLPTLQWVPLLSTMDPPWSSALNRRHQQRPSLPREVTPLSREAMGHCPTCWIPPPGVPWSRHGRAACRALAAPPPARWMLMTAAWMHSTPLPSK